MTMLKIISVHPCFVIICTLAIIFKGLALFILPDIFLSYVLPHFISLAVFKENVKVLS